MAASLTLLNTSRNLMGLTMEEASNVSGSGSPRLGPAQWRHGCCASAAGPEGIASDSQHMPGLLARRRLPGWRSLGPDGFLILVFAIGGRNTGTSPRETGPPLRRHSTGSQSHTMPPPSEALLNRSLTLSSRALRARFR